MLIKIQQKAGDKEININIVQFQKIYVLLYNTFKMLSLLPNYGGQVG